MTKLRSNNLLKSFFMIMVLALSVWACSSDNILNSVTAESTIESKNDKSEVTILFANDVSRSWTVASYEVEATNSNVSTPITGSSSTETVKLTLTAGNWTFTASGKDENGVLIYRGKFETTISSQNEKITIMMIKNSGSMVYDITKLGNNMGSVTQQIKVVASRNTFSDINVTVSSFNDKAVFQGLAVGTWTFKTYLGQEKINEETFDIVADAVINKESSISTTTSTTSTSSTTSTTTTTTTTIQPITDKIIVHWATSTSKPKIYAWSTDGNNTKYAGSWSGTSASDNDNDGYYDYTLNYTSSNIIFNDGNNQTEDLLISAAGEYWWLGTQNGDSSDWTTTNPNVPPEPVLPTVTISPANGSQIALNGSISVSFTNGNDTITAATATINSTQYSMGTSGSFKKSVSELGITTVGASISISVSVTNSVGTTTASATLTTKEAPVITNDFNSLTIYQVMVSSFQDGDPSRGYEYAYGPQGSLTGGDLQGIINAADYIKDLGCNAIWMTPIFDSSSGSSNTYLNSTGYFTYDYFNIDPKFGTNETFRTLVETYHSKGMYVILDGVFGHHCGNVATSPKGNTVSGTDPVNYPASLEFYKEVAEYWIKNYDIDGWRLDQCYQVGLGDNAKGEKCATNGHNYWYEIRQVVKAAAEANQNSGKEWGTLGYMVGEHWHGDASVIQKGSIDKGTAAGYGLQSCFDFPARYKLVQHFAIEESKNVKDVSLKDALEYTFSTSEEKGYVHDEGYYPNLFITNHDLVRFGNLLNWAFSISPSSGDTYWGRHRLAMATLAAYTGPITIYYGDEWGAYVEGYSGPGSLGAYNDNVSRSTGKISGFNSNEQALINYTKKLLAARADNEAMWNGANETVSATSDLYVGKKTLGNQTIIYGINNSGSQKTFSASGTVLVDNGENGSSVSGTAKVAPYSATFIIQN